MNYKINQKMHGPLMIIDPTLGQLVINQTFEVLMAYFGPIGNQILQSTFSMVYFGPLYIYIITFSKFPMA